MYVALKTIHILAVVAFLGNISIGLYWKSLADRTGIAAIMEYTVGGIILADRLITIPSIVVLVAAGVALAMAAGIPVLGTGWVLWAILLLVLSGLAFVPVTRAQIGLREAAATGLSTAEEKNLYERLSRQWNLWGSIALVAPLIALVLMVTKPVLPALHQ
jgi:uncharacterized membrane protein